MVSPEMGRKLTGRVEAWRSAAQKREDAPDGNRAEPKLNPRQRAPCHLPRHPAPPSRESSAQLATSLSPRFKLLFALRNEHRSFELSFQSQSRSIVQMMWRRHNRRPISRRRC